MEDTVAKSVRNMEKSKSLTVLNGFSYFCVRKVKKSYSFEWFQQLNNQKSQKVLHF